MRGIDPIVIDTILNHAKPSAGTPLNKAPLIQNRGYFTLSFRVVNHGTPIGHLNGEHQAILTAVRARNRKQAATLMSEHINRATIGAQCEFANEQVVTVPWTSNRYIYERQR